MQAMAAAWKTDHCLLVPLLLMSCANSLILSPFLVHFVLNYFIEAHGHRVNGTHLKCLI